MYPDTLVSKILFSSAETRRPLGLCSKAWVVLLVHCLAPFCWCDLELVSYHPPDSKRMEKMHFDSLACKGRGNQHL